eukprot:Filipodium_phascolosomae@DN5231_c0_g1_i1.p1
MLYGTFITFLALLLAVVAVVQVEGSSISSHYEDIKRRISPISALDRSVRGGTRTALLNVDLSRSVFRSSSAIRSSTTYRDSKDAEYYKRKSIEHEAELKRTKESVDRLLEGARRRQVSRPVDGDNKRYQDARSDTRRRLEKYH